MSRRHTAIVVIGHEATLNYHGLPTLGREPVGAPRTTPDTMEAVP